MTKRSPRVERVLREKQAYDAGVAEERARWNLRLEMLRKEASEAFEQLESLVEPDGAEEHGYHRGLSRALDILTGKSEAL